MGDDNLLLWNYDVYGEEDESYVVINGYNGEDSNITIPSILEGYPVTGIAEDTLRETGSITNVDIPGSVTSIGDNAFFDCGLESVYFHGNPPTLGTGAFTDNLPDFIVYYYFGFIGWTNPWNGFTTKMVSSTQKNKTLTTKGMRSLIQSLILPYMNT
jgi:hypothetical protein